MLESLQTAGVRSLVLCAPDSPRALPVEIVAEAALGLGMDVRTAPTVADAVTDAVDSAGPDDRCIICGSLYVVADARRRLVGDGP
jgi:folylpolyglutamate synthase/dihydropteroate synthase